MISARSRQEQFPNGDVPREVYESKFEVVIALNEYMERGSQAYIAEEDKRNYQKLVEVLEQHFGKAYLALIKRRNPKSSLMVAV